MSDQLILIRDALSLIPHLLITTSFAVVLSSSDTSWSHGSSSFIIFLAQSQAKATLAQFEVQQRSNCSRARDTSITPVIIKSTIVVCTMMLPGEAWRVVLAPGMTATAPTKHTPISEANAQMLELLAS